MLPPQTVICTSSAMDDPEKSISVVFLSATKSIGLLLIMVIFNIILYLAIGERAGLNQLNHARHDFPFNTG